jgi:hypothetical protein
MSVLVTSSQLHLQSSSPNKRKTSSPLIVVCWHCWHSNPVGFGPAWRCCQCAGMAEEVHLQFATKTILSFEHLAAA